MLIGDPVAVVFGFKGNASFRKRSLDKIGWFTHTHTHSLTHTFAFESTAFLNAQYLVLI